MRTLEPGHDHADDREVDVFVREIDGDDLFDAHRCQPAEQPQHIVIEALVRGVGRASEATLATAGDARESGSPRLPVERAHVLGDAQVVARARHRRQPRLGRLTQRT